MSTMRVTNLKHESSALNNVVLNSDGSVGGELGDTLAAKPTFTYGTATPTADADGAIWYDENDTPPTPKFWDGSAWQPFSSGLAWAVVSSPSATGNYTDGNGDEWNYYEFTSSGSLTISTAGLVDVLIVSGGGGGKGGYYEGTGSWLNGYHELAATTHTVTVGAGGAGNNQTSAQNGTPSSIGSIAARYGGAAPGVSGSNGGITSSITGSSIGYAYHAQASPRTNRGDGATSGSNGAGSSGIVIVRVKV